MYNYLRITILMLSPPILFIKVIMVSSFVLLILLILLKNNCPISTLSEHVVLHTVLSHF